LRQTELAVIGGGPAGLAAALAAAEAGVRVTIVEQDDRLGGQLVKQTHKFFGSEKQSAGRRGIVIAAEQARAAATNKNIDVMLEAAALGYYDDGVLTVEQGDRFIKLKAGSYLFATGASEKMLAFPNNDLPGVYGAGAVQTLMNVHGVKPADTVVMVGAGNIGLIVSYQLMQAGVKVAAIVEAAPTIGGYLVHAAKVRRAGVPIFTGHTVKEAHGTDVVSGVTIAALDQTGATLAGTEKMITCDCICLAVGLSPLAELLWHAGCRMVHIPELGGHVAWRNENLETSVPGIFIAGDVAGIEEASSAMVEGRLAGLAAAAYLGHGSQFDSLKAELVAELGALRSGPAGAKIRQGLAALAGM